MWTIDFVNPIFLWLLVLLPMLIGAHFFFLKRNQVKALKFANFVAIKRIAGQKLVTKNITVLVLRFLIILCIILTLAGATIWYDGLRNDFDYVIAIDTSSSMSAIDIEPSRLDAAKSAATDFIDNMESSSKVGIVSFSGVTYVLNPLTNDFLNLRLKIGSINLSRISGTDISGAIITATNMFPETSKGKAVILLTDGSDTVGAYLENNVRLAAEYAASQHVTVHAIGLGAEDTLVGYLPEDFNLTVGIDSSSLNLITNITHGDAVYPQSAEDLIRYFQDVDSRAHEAQLDFDLAKYTLYLAFFFLIIEWILINLIFRRVV